MSALSMCGGSIVTASHGDLAGPAPGVRDTCPLFEGGWSGRIRSELLDNILPFWTNRAVDRENGGFYGSVDSVGIPHKNAERSSVLNTRILWTFSTAARIFGDAYREIAERAFVYITDKFWDSESEGLFWMLDSQGTPVSSQKKIYGQAFGIYGLAEFYRATGSAAALDLAKRLFQLIEQHGRDHANQGYWESFGRDWRPLEDMRLSEKDLNCPKSMNTNLHVLEAYTNLLRVSGDPDVRASLADLIDVFMERIVDANAGHLKQFFDKQWNSQSGVVSYGHDIEASWLLLEAASVLGDPALIARTRELSVTLAGTVLRDGLSRDGGVAYEEDASHATVDATRHWWVQAEAVVGFCNAYQVSGDRRFLEASRRVWDFIEAAVVDRTHGEWHAKVSPGGRPLTEQEDNDVGLISPWKCPYHNARACFEMLERLGSLE
jgi:mannobiose 2-epimerase